MMKEKALGMFGGIISVVWLLTVIVDFLLGKSDTFSTVLLFVVYFLAILWPLLTVLNKILEKVIEFRAYKQCEKIFQSLQIVYKARYQLYFTGTTEEIGKDGNGKLMIRGL